MKTKLRIFKGVRKGTITPKRRCPDCNKWMVMKTPFVILEDVIIVGLMTLTFIRLISVYIFPFIFLATIFIFSIFAPFQKYNKKVFNVDNVIIEGNKKD
jgi:hypothetical protein